MQAIEFLENVSAVTDYGALCEAYLTKVVEVTKLRGYIHTRGTVTSIWDPRPKAFKDLEIGSVDAYSSRTTSATVQVAENTVLVLYNSSKSSNAATIQSISGITSVARVLFDKIRAVQETQRVHETLLSCVSHELRTPLNGIIGLTRILKTRLPDGDMKTYAGVTHTCGMQLVGIINDLLDHSRLQTNQLALTPRPTSIVRCVNDSIDIVKTKFPSAKFSVRQMARLEDAACIDEYRMKQMIVNLLVNSAKYGNPSEAVMVRIGGSDHIVEIDVIDSGPGIPPEAQNTIFEAFTRAAVSSNIEGTGLGLFISRRIARLMGGDVRIKQTSAEGTTMSISVLRKMPSNTAKPPVADSSVQTRSTNFLIVDDIDYNATVLTSILTELSPGCTVHVADSGLQAITRCSTTVYDLVLMDIRMPGKMDGYATTRAILDLYRFRGCSPPKIIAVSAYVGQEDVDRCERAGMAGFVSKPVDPQEIAKFM